LLQVPENPIKDVIRFGTFEADLRAGELSPQWHQNTLQEQPFQVLAMLLERPGEIVTREELHSRLWPADTFVDFDHGLNAAVKRLARCPRDSAENPRFIETLARRGYRLLVPVNGAARENAPLPHAGPSWRVGLAAVVSLLAGIIAGWHAGHRSAAAVRFTERRLTANPENDPVFSAAISTGWQVPRLYRQNGNLSPCSGNGRNPSRHNTGRREDPSCQLVS